jgi:hypothetical protein
MSIEKVSVGKILNFVVVAEFLSVSARGSFSRSFSRQPGGEVAGGGGERKMKRCPLVISCYLLLQAHFFYLS